jgi:hypothetical protein
MEEPRPLKRHDALRWPLTAFCALAWVAWAASLVFVCVNLTLAARCLSSLGPVAACLVFLVFELGGAAIVGRKIGKKADVLSSWWTPVAVVAGLLVGVVNLVAGLEVG